VDKSVIEKLLEESENVDIEMLTVDSLKKLLLGFEKKINKNQKLRMKYPDEPEKFMDSEVELHEELNALYALSASPELYPTFVQAGSVQSLLGMVAHENTDVSLAAVGLLQELTDPETILESEETTMPLIDALLEGQCLELIVQNMARLDETNEEDSQGVHDSLSTLDNLLEVQPSLALTIVEKTHILKYLLTRLRVKNFDQNKLYCSELLSMLLQKAPAVSKRLANVAGVDDGLDALLQIVSQYRKREPDTSEEQECVQNIFLSLCTALMDADNKNHFRSCEGMELMVRCLKENKYAASCASRAITYAITNNRFVISPLYTM
jgi:beta-catenin-like protein 1